MSNYILRESNTSKNFTPSALVKQVFGRERKVTGITIHHWGVLGQTFTNVEKFLCTNNTPTSAHFVVQASLVSCIVNPDDAAWHSGSAVGNATTIGLELRPEATDGDYVTAAELIHYLRGIYGDVPLIPHKHWHATACPGKWDLARLDRMARAVGTTEVRPQAATTAPADQGDKMLIIGQVEGDPRVWIGDGVTKRHIPNPETLNAYVKFAQAGSLKVKDNGVVQKLTWVELEALGVNVQGMIVDSRKETQLHEEHTRKVLGEKIDAA